jgi:hypothetical protein
MNEIPSEINSRSRKGEGEEGEESIELDKLGRGEIATILKNTRL